MTEEQITNRYVRGWISLEEFRSEMVKFYDREDSKDRVDRIVKQAFAERDRESGDPIATLARLVARIALADAKVVTKAEAEAEAECLTAKEVNAIAAALDAALAGDGFNGGDFDGMDRAHFERAHTRVTELIKRADPGRPVPKHGSGP